MESQIVVVDTDVIVDYAHHKSPTLVRYLTLQEKEKVKLIVSVVTIFEYFSGSSLLDSLIHEKSDELFSCFAVCEITDGISRLAAKLNREHKLYNMQYTDLLIGATCLSINGQLLTRNKKHFKHIPNISFAP